VTFEPNIGWHVKQYGRHRYVWAVVDDRSQQIGAGTEMSFTRAMRRIDACVTEHFFPADQTWKGDYVALQQTMNGLDNDIEEF